MQIDWLTVGAQIVNFLILVWLLHRFLYGPITRAMDRRQERIVARLQEAGDKRAEAETEARSYREKQKELDTQRENLIAAAEDDADKLRHQLEGDVHREFDDERRKWRVALNSEHEAFLRDLRVLALKHFQGLARRALKDLADEDLEDRIISAFLRRLRKLDRETRAKITTALQDSRSSLNVTSAFEIDAEQKREITKTIQEEFLTDIEVTYDRLAEIACGIVLKAGGQAILWNLDNYLNDLEVEVGEALIAQIPSHDKKSAERIKRASC